MAGLVKPDKGEIRLNGEDITKVPIHIRGKGLAFRRILRRQAT